MTTRLSSLQYPMLRMFATDASDEYMSIEVAQRFDQRPFRSMLYRGWIRYTPRRGFRITKDGREAWRDFESRSIIRKNPALPLTSYFDADAYQIHAAKGSHTGSPARGAAA